MSILSSHSLALGLRITQLLFGLGFLILLAWSNQNQGYWTNLQGPVALGVVTFLFTLVVGIHGCWIHYKKSMVSHGRIFKIVRITLEFIIFLMWIGTATLMLRPQQIDLDKPLVPAPPFVEWDLGIAFTFVEIVAFAITFILEILSLRSGGSGSAVSYV